MSYIKDKLFYFVKELIYKDRLGLFAYAGIFWKMSSSLKNFLYAKKIFKSKSLPLCVVSVGSITAGGSGKTPFVILLSNILKKKLAIAILSRGYRSYFENKGALVNKTDDFSKVGDEPLMMKRELDLPVAIGKNRRKAFKLIENEKFQLVILDDGFQHRSLKRDFEILLLRSDDPFGQGRFLPAGFLRDSPEELKRADFILFTGVDENCDLSELEKKVRPFSNAPIGAVKTVICGVYNFKGERVDISRHEKCGGFAAIAHPANFLESLNKTGLKVVAQNFKADHASFSLAELKDLAFAALRAQATCLICTEKDFVKFREDITLIPVYFLKIRQEIIFGKEEFEKFIEKIVFKANNYNNLNLG